MSSGPNLPGYRSNKTYAKPRPNASGTRDLNRREGDWFAPESADRRTGKSETKASFVSKSVVTSETLLSYDAYWKEEIFDSNERFRFRLVKILYVVEDGSMKVFEKRGENSGLLQGVFLKRGRVPKPDGGFLGLHDLEIGKTISIYNRVFVIYGCTEETREWLKSSGIDVPANMDVPEDDFTSRQKASKEKSIKLKKTPMKLYVEALRGKAVGSVEKLGDFLKHSGEVLRFYACWDDRESLYGELNRYIIHYFLADGSLEIRDVKIPNSGKADFPLLLGRSKLPKNWRDEVHQVDKRKDASNFVNERDLYVGGRVHVYGRELLLTSCDEFTKRYYMDNYGFKENQFIEIVVEEPKKPAPEAGIYTPHFGGVACFGTDEDSLQSCLSLHPKPVKRDIEKLMLNQKNLLRYGAKLDTTKPEDVDRRFIITYYMADDTIAVFEDVKRNSGRMPGKFLRKMKVRNPKTGKDFVPEDFKVGTIVTINSFRFFVDGVDTFTQRFTVDTKEVLLRLHRSFIHSATDEKGEVVGNSKIREVKAIFGAMDKDKSGYITLPELQKYIRTTLKEEMQAKEIVMAMQFFDNNNDGRVSLDEFVIWLQSDPSEWGPIGSSDTVGDFAQVYHAKLSGAVGEETRLIKLKIALKRYAMAFYEKDHDFLQIFEKYDKEKTGEVTREGFFRALQMASKFAAGGIDSKFPMLIVDYLFEGDCRVIKYRDFLKLLSKQDIPSM